MFNRLLIDFCQKLPETAEYSADQSMINDKLKAANFLSYWDSQFLQYLDDINHIDSVHRFIAIAVFDPFLKEQTSSSLVIYQILNQLNFELFKSNFRYQFLLTQFDGINYLILVDFTELFPRRNGIALT